MIDLYTAPTPNGHKISIMLAELNLEYDLVEYDIAKGDQFKPECGQGDPHYGHQAVNHDLIAERIRQLEKKQETSVQQCVLERQKPDYHKSENGRSKNRSLDTQTVGSRYQCA